MTRKVAFLTAAVGWITLDIIGAATGFWDTDGNKTADMIFGAGTVLWLHWIYDEAPYAGTPRA